MSTPNRHGMIIGLLGCLIVAIPAWAQRFTPPNHALFPLEPGAQWVYRGKTAAGAVLITRKVTSVARTDQGKRAEVAVSMEGVPADQIQFVQVFEYRAGKIFEAQSYRSPYNVGTTEPALLLPGREVLQEGHIWITDTGSSHAAPGGSSEIQIRESHRVVGWERVTVPAGRFYALRIDSSVTVRGSLTVPIPGEVPVPAESASWSSWYAPFVGPVKTRSPEGVEELVSFNLRPDPCEYAVIDLRGNVKLNGKPLGVEIGYAPRQRVQTLERSRVQLMLGSGEILQVGENTTYELEQATICGRVQEPKRFQEKVTRIVKLILGRLWFTMGAWFGPKDQPPGTSKFRFRGTATGGGVRGTAFALEVTEAYDLWEVSEGSVEVTYFKTGETFLLKAGDRKKFPH